MQLISRPLHVRMNSVIVFGLSLLAIFSSCKKLDAEYTHPTERQALSQSAARAAALNSAASTPYDCGNTVCEDCEFQEEASEDTIDQVTILGDLYTNPYSIEVMTQAHNIVYHANVQSVSTTHYYVKFKPQTEDDVDKLDSLGVDVFDYPLDREVVQRGITGQMHTQTSPMTNYHGYMRWLNRTFSSRQEFRTLFLFRYIFQMMIRQ
jgi:hypothetical protein